MTVTPRFVITPVIKLWRKEIPYSRCGYPQTCTNGWNKKSKHRVESKSDIAIAALTAYLIPPTPEDEVSQLKRRVEALERRIGL